MIGILSFIRAVLGRDLSIALRSGGGWLHGLVFFGVFVLLMAFGFGPQPSALQIAAIPTVWLGTLFAVQFAAADMFVSDLEDGTLHVLAVEQNSLLSYCIGKTIGVILIVGLPVLVVTPFVYMMLALNGEQIWVSLPALIIGIVALILATLVASAINTALRGGGRFTAILAAPLSIPVLIFGVEASEQAVSTGGIWGAELQFLLALTLFLSAIAPPFATLALRSGVD